MTLPSRPGNWRTRSPNTSPTVAPSARTDAWPLASGRRMVGKRTSTDTAAPEPGEPGKLTCGLVILPTLQNDRLLGDVPIPVDLVAAHHRRLILQADDHVVPARPGAVDVGLRGVGVGVGVGVHGADDLQALARGVLVGGLDLAFDHRVDAA